MPRKGRARRFREARELKQGFDDDLFSEGSGSLADVEEGTVDEDKGWDDDDDEHGDDWDADDPLAIDERRSGADGGRRASWVALGEPGVDRLGVDPVTLDRFGHRLVLHVALPRERAQRGDDDVRGVDLEVPAQCFPRVREAVAVGAE